MGQKVNPIGFRLAVSKDWRSKWFANRQEYANFLHNDIKIRNLLKAELKTAAISRIVIERAWNSVRVTLFTAKPGMVIGKRGADIETLNARISEMSGGKAVKIDILEVKQPETDAQLIAENVAQQLERRISHRRAMKRSIQLAMELGALGVRVRIAGRVGGADIARTEQYREGKVPLQTLRTPIDYGFAEAATVYGIIGVKVWVNKREGSDEENAANRQNRGERRDRGPRRDGGRGPGGGGGRGPGGGGRGPGGGGGRGPGGGGRGPAPEAAPEAPAAEVAAEYPRFSLVRQRSLFTKEKSNTYF